MMSMRGIKASVIDSEIDERTDGLYIELLGIL